LTIVLAVSLQRETDNTMVNKETKTKRDRQYNGQQRNKDEERQTIQWSTKRQRRREIDNTMVIKETKTKRDRQYNGQQRDKDEER
jgi:hypothetical protein